MDPAHNQAAHQFLRPKARHQIRLPVKYCATLTALGRERQHEKYYDLTRIYLPRRRRLLLELQAKKSPRKSCVIKTSSTFSSSSKDTADKLPPAHKPLNERLENFHSSSASKSATIEAGAEHELEDIMQKANQNIANLYTEINSYFDNYKDSSVITQMNLEKSDWNANATQEPSLNVKHFLKFRWKRVNCV